MECANPDAPAKLTQHTYLSYLNMIVNVCCKLHIYLPVMIATFPDRSGMISKLIKKNVALTRESEPFFICHALVTFFRP